MKKKVRMLSPFLAITTLFLIAATVVGYFYVPDYIFYCEAAASCLAIIMTIVYSIRYRVYVKKTLKGAYDISGHELENLNKMQLPLLIVDNDDEIIWSNAAFSKYTEDTIVGDYLFEVFGGMMMKDVKDEIVNVEYNNYQFTVFGRNTDAGGMLYFFDDTDYKKQYKEFEGSRPVVILVAFDNKDEISVDCNSGEETRILGQFESTLNDWAYSNGGLYKKISGGSRYIIVMDESAYQHEKQGNFAILQAIRNIKTADGESATASIGIGRGDACFAEIEKRAKESLNMALGRGGDQIAVRMESDSYEFYGGLSSAKEKQDKSRIRFFANRISELIKDSDLVLCMGHKYSDLDSIGSSVGMWCAARRGMKKNSFVVVDKSSTLSTALIERIEKDAAEEESPVFISPNQAYEIMTPRTLVIVTDTHSREYVESEKVLNKAHKVVVIDHHRLVVNHIKNPDVFFHETYASSASEMVAELVQFIGRQTIRKTEALALLAGIILDTKGFVIRCGVRTFEAAAYLRRRGADSVEAKRLFSGTIESYKSKLDIVSKAEVYNKTSAISCIERTDIPDLRIIASQAADEMLDIQGVKASFVLFAYGDTISVSARSLGDVNVQVLMEELGGGGHLTMAGAQIKGVTLEQAKAQLCHVLDTSLSKATKFHE